MTDKGFLHSSVGKSPACNAGGPGSISASGRYPGEGNRNPLQYPCLENTVDRGAWWAAAHRVAQSRTRLNRLSMHACVGEGKATHSIILAWRFLGTEEPDGLPSMGSHRVRHD